MSELPDLAALLGGRLGGDEPTAGMAGVENAQQLWAMLDEMALSDPAAYAEFMSAQMDAMQAEEAAALPQPAFCARVHVSEPAAMAGALFVNACGHRSMKPAASPDGPINLAVGVLRDGEVDAELAAATALACTRSADAAHFVDVLTSHEQLARARADAGYRRELCELFVQCVEQTHGLRVKRNSLTLLNPLRLGYAGGKVQRFPRAQSAAGSGAEDALGVGLRLPNAPSSTKPTEHNAPSLGPARPLIQELHSKKAEPSQKVEPSSQPQAAPSPASVGHPAPAAAAAEPAGQPTGHVGLTPEVEADAAGGGGGGKGLMAEPAYELLLGATAADGSAALFLRVLLPSVASGGGIELELSDTAVQLEASVQAGAEGGSCLCLRLRLEWPVAIDSALAVSKWDKKRRELRILAPLLEPPATGSAVAALDCEQPE
ncbi:hypothetical protein T492DRAFT_255071 [Pavlovales sp. CCMP2436]|nr:hypothetical protein T492DRAFT_255071 [Pavlovales sp. CCMP2436]